MSFDHPSGSPALRLADIAAGLHPGYRSVRIFGQLDDVAEGVAQDLSQIGVDVIPRPAAAVSMEIVSTSDDDMAPSGIGARAVRLIGLEDDYDQVTQDILLGGLTPVAVPISLIRVNFWLVIEGTPVGDLILRDLGGGTEYARIMAGANAALTGEYTVPASARLMVLSWSCAWAMGAPPGAGMVRLLATVDPLDGTLSPDIFQLHDAIAEKDSSHVHGFALPYIMPAQADIKMSAFSPPPGGGTLIGIIESVLFDDGRRVPAIVSQGV